MAGHLRKHVDADIRVGVALHGVCVREMASTTPHNSSRNLQPLPHTSLGQDSSNIEGLA